MRLPKPIEGPRPKPPLCFWLVRDEDVSGVSGVGIIAEGVLFDTGKAVLAWRTAYRSVAVYDSIEDLIAIHGHEGKTHIAWLDAHYQ